MAAGASSRAVGARVAPVQEQLGESKRSSGSASRIPLSSEERARINGVVQRYNQANALVRRENTGLRDQIAGLEAKTEKDRVLLTTVALAGAAVLFKASTHSSRPSQTGDSSASSGPPPAPSQLPQERQRRTGILTNSVLDNPPAPVALPEQTQPRSVSLPAQLPPQAPVQQSPSVQEEISFSRTTQLPDGSVQSSRFSISRYALETANSIAQSIRTVVQSIAGTTRSTPTIQVEVDHSAPPALDEPVSLVPEPPALQLPSRDADMLRSIRRVPEPPQAPFPRWDLPQPRSTVPAEYDGLGVDAEPLVDAAPLLSENVPRADGDQTYAPPRSVDYGDYKR